MRGMTSPAPLHDGRQLQLLIWESDVTTAGDGRVTLTARRPISHMSTKQAAKILGLSEWGVADLYRMNLIQGFKPGARVARKDGRASNAALRLDSGSVLEYRAARELRREFWM
jgi:hypothetical protein